MFTDDDLLSYQPLPIPEELYQEIEERDRFLEPQRRAWAEHQADLEQWCHWWEQRGLE